MATPTWLGYAFAVLMVSVSVYCLGRLVAARPLGRRNHFDVNVAHVLMGAAMIGMLVPRWNVAPRALCVAIFSAMAAYFAVQAIRFVRRHGILGSDSGHVHHVTHALAHLVMALAMLYMYWLGMPLSLGGAASAMSGAPTTAGDPTLTLLLLVLLLGSAVWELDGMGRLVAVRPAVAPVGALGGGGGGAGGGFATPEVRWLAPRLEAWCHIAMCLTMAYMLVLMV